jgi:hypothetical protein
VTKPDLNTQAYLDSLAPEAPRWRTFLYNVETTVEIIAETEDEALDILNRGGGEVIDRDVMMVEEGPYGANSY